MSGKSRSKGVLDKTYGYQDENGQLVHETVRFRDPKRFLQRRPDPSKPGGWNWSLKGIKTLLYRLPELLAADPDATVFVVEGEKDVDRIRQLGRVATSNPMGAGKWLDYYSDWLRGRHVVALADNDDKGREHAEVVAKSLYGKAASIKIVYLEGLPERGDASDYLDARKPIGTIEDIEAIAADTPLWTPSRAETPVPKLRVFGIDGGRDDSGSNPDEDLNVNDRLAGFPYTDMGNAERLIARHGTDIRYCGTWKKWLVYDGCRWKIDDSGTVRSKAQQAARMILAEASTIEDSDRRKAHVAWARATEDTKRLSSMVREAEVMAGVPIAPDDMDKDGWLFNVANGTINLKTGDLIPHDRSHLITKLCPIHYDPSADCPLWLATLARFLCRDDPEKQVALIDYWQRLCGYAMAGRVRDHVFPIAYGAGSNGKSTILGALLAIFGLDYAMRANADMLMSKRRESHTTEHADFFGKRLVVIFESEKDRQFNEGLLKSLTGGDKIRARRMREDNWEFNPTHTIFFATNHKPVIKGTDNGIWRRVKMIPFTVSMPDAIADTAMPEKLLSESPGILAWCVRGCLKWLADDRLNEPEEVAIATKGYRAEQDILGHFTEDCAELGADKKVRSKDLYERYREWAVASNEQIQTLTAFGNAMKERGFGTKTSNGVWYLGIALKPKEDTLDPLKQWLKVAVSVGKCSVRGTIEEAGRQGLLKRDSDSGWDARPLFHAGQELGYVMQDESGSKVWINPDTESSLRFEETI